MIDRTLTGIFVYYWWILPFVGLILLGMTEVGFRFGRQLHRRKDEALKGQIGGIQGAILGILALLLGFTFAMAMNRYETRRELVLKEANAIATTYLRASFLPAPDQIAVEDLLRQYVDVRLAFYAAGNDEGKIAAAESEAGKIQRELWSRTVGAGKESPSALTASFVNALNDAIEFDATRMQAMQMRVPGVVWILVLLVASCGCCVTGYAAGASGKRGAFTNVILPLLITVIIFLIADLDSPRHGIIGVNQAPMLDLQRSLQPAEL
jgi:hypothetical protein